MMKGLTTRLGTNVLALSSASKSLPKGLSTAMYFTCHGLKFSHLHAGVGPSTSVISEMEFQPLYLALWLCVRIRALASAGCLKPQQQALTTEIPPLR